MQNKPNLMIAEMNVTDLLTMLYRKNGLGGHLKQTQNNLTFLGGDDIDYHYSDIIVSALIICSSDKLNASLLRIVFVL